MKRKISSLIVTASLLLLICNTACGQAFIPLAVEDATPAGPLVNPSPFSYQPRYPSGFGMDGSFTVFFEDRGDPFRAIHVTSTSSGVNGFSASATKTNLLETHFLAKNWPIEVNGTSYPFRAWGSVGNNPQHRFYVADDPSNWILVSTFTIPNASTFSKARGEVYYGFHDVILLNGTYYAFAESNRAQTMIVRSTRGDDVWEAFASVGGMPGDGPLGLPSGETYGWTASGGFVDLGHGLGYGKIYIDPSDRNLYLAINIAARGFLPAPDLEAAFINASNWKWHVGAVGRASHPILCQSEVHDFKECWIVPRSDSGSDWHIIYTADFGPGNGGIALGYAILRPPLALTPIKPRGLRID